MSKNLNYVRFDVGHYLYVCHKNTILKYENSVLAKYIAPHFDRRTSEMDYITIDRDGKHFGSILNFMRDPTSLDLCAFNSSDLTDLMREADFYCLTELIELCDNEFCARETKMQQEREMQDSRQNFSVPASRKLEIIYGYDIMRKLLNSTEKPLIVISYRSMRRFHIDAWFEELVKLCDHNKFKVYCFSDKSIEHQNISDKQLVNFIVSYYDPEEKRFSLTISAPEYENFRNRRSHYKCKIFKFWFLIQNDTSRFKSVSSPTSSMTPVINERI